MDQILRKMQESVRKYAEVIARVLRVDVEIVDDTLFRVAGTGHFADIVGQSMAITGRAYGQVIRSGKPCIIEKPGFSPVCRGCRFWQHCDETFEMCTPILLGSEVIGVVGFVCFTEEQKRHILANQLDFYDFLGQMGDLIASKAVEMQEYERSRRVGTLLENIVDKMEEGVLMLAGNDEVVRMNARARVILGLKKGLPHGSRAVLVRGEGGLAKYQKFDLRLNRKNYSVVGEIYPLNIGEVSRCFLFRDLEVMQLEAMRLVSGGERIGLDAFVGDSAALDHLKSQILRLAKSSATVLLQGESGTGKELAARALHHAGKTPGGPFVAVNCGAIPETLLESELFGYAGGAFTGADPKGRIGKFEQANGGTIFLDEIGDMPLHLQVKILRVLEQREVRRLGSAALTPITARVVAATNRRLEEMVEIGEFREDLFYRLNVIPIALPSLRERPEDLPVLTDFFVTRYLGLLDKSIVRIDDAFRQVIADYPWPGNVRELQNAIEFSVSMLDGTGILKAELLPPRVRLGGGAPGGLRLDAMERSQILKALSACGNDGRAAKSEAARMLGISVATLYRKIAKYGL